MQMSLRDVGSFGQAGEVEEGSAHPQTDEEELRDELEVDEELLVAQVSLLWCLCFCMSECQWQLRGFSTVVLTARRLWVRLQA